jgi:hypothetical protein
MSERIDIDVDVLKESLDEARSNPYLVHEQMNWLETYSPVAHLAIVGFKIGEHQTATMVGFAVGTSVVRGHIDVGVIGLNSMAENHRIHFADKCLKTGRLIDESRFKEIFDEEVGDVLVNLSNAHTSTFMALMLITSFSDESTPETQRFISLPPARRRQTTNRSRKSGFAR